MVLNTLLCVTSHRRRTRRGVEPMGRRGTDAMKRVLSGRGISRMVIPPRQLVDMFALLEVFTECC